MYYTRLRADVPENGNEQVASGYQRRGMQNLKPKGKGCIMYPG
jgi:hypothetical protein